MAKQRRQLTEVDSTKPTVPELARQMVTDLARSMNAPMPSMEINRLGPITSVYVNFGVLGYNNDASNIVSLRIDLDSNDAEFFVNDQAVAKCDVNLEGYPAAQLKVIRAVSDAQANSSTQSNVFPGMPTYADMQAVPGPYGKDSNATDQNELDRYSNDDRQVIIDAACDALSELGITVNNINNQTRFVDLTLNNGKHLKLQFMNAGIEVNYQQYNEIAAPFEIAVKDAVNNVVARPISRNRS